MKKRLRKKLRVGEFTELSFVLTGKIAPQEEAAQEAFLENFFQAVADCGCCLNGVFSAEDFDLEVITGPVGSDNEARREELLAKLKEMTEITEFDAGTLE